MKVCGLNSSGAVWLGFVRKVQLVMESEEAQFYQVAWKCRWLFIPLQTLADGEQRLPESWQADFLAACSPHLLLSGLAAVTNFASLNIGSLCLLPTLCYAAIWKDLRMYFEFSWLSCPEYSAMCKIDLIPKHLNSGEINCNWSGRYNLFP